MKTESTTLVEKTSKRLKLHTLLAVGLLLVGIATTLIGANTDNAAPPVIAGIALTVGGLGSCSIWISYRHPRSDVPIEKFTERRKVDGQFNQR